MKKMQNHIVKDNRIFVGLEDSKRTWKLCVRCDGMIVHEVSMPTEYENLLMHVVWRRIWSRMIVRAVMYPTGSFVRTDRSAGHWTRFKRILSEQRTVSESFLISTV